MYNDPNQPQPPPYGQPQPPYGVPPNPYEQQPNPYEQPQWGQQQQPPTQYAPQPQYTAPPYGPPPAPGYAQPQQQAKKSNRWIWITLGIIGGLLVLGCAGCVITLGLLGKAASNAVTTVEQTATASSKEDVQTTVNDYYSAIQSQDYSTAFSYLAPDLTTSNGETVTQDLYTSAASARDTSDGKVSTFNVTADPSDSSSFTVQVTRNQGSSYTVHIKVRQINGQWKITSYDNI